MDQIYQDYLSCLMIGYERLRSKFILFSTKALSPKQKEMIGLNLTAPPLNLPGSSVQIPYNSSQHLLHEQLISTEEKENQNHQFTTLETRNLSQSKNFSERVGSIDPTKVATYMIFEINMVAG